MTRASELRELDPKDRSTRLEESQKELFNLRFQLATGRLDNVSRIGVLRREIARLRTLETEEAYGIERNGAPVRRGRSKTTKET